MHASNKQQTPREGKNHINACLNCAYKFMMVWHGSVYTFTNTVSYGNLSISYHKCDIGSFYYLRIYPSEWAASCCIVHTIIKYSGWFIGNQIYGKKVSGTKKKYWQNNYPYCLLWRCECALARITVTFTVVFLFVAACRVVSIFFFITRSVCDVRLLYAVLCRTWIFGEWSTVCYLNKTSQIRFWRGDNGANK